MEAVNNFNTTCTTFASSRIMRSSNMTVMHEANATTRDGFFRKSVNNFDPSMTTDDNERAFSTCNFKPKQKPKNLPTIRAEITNKIPNLRHSVGIREPKRPFNSPLSSHFPSNLKYTNNEKFVDINSIRDSLRRNKMEHHNFSTMY